MSNSNFYTDWQDNEQPNNRSTPQRHKDSANIPKPLELLNMEPSRDSGCFTDSPLSGTSSAGLPATARRFKFGESLTSSHNRVDSGREDSVFPDDNNSSSDDEDVFHMSLDRGDDCVFGDGELEPVSSWLNSENDKTTSRETSPKMGAHAVGKSVFYVPRSPSDSDESDSEDESTEEEFSTAEYNITPSIPIPTVQQEQCAHEEEMSLSLPASLERVPRRPHAFAASQSDTSHHNGRPQSGRGRIQGVAQAERSRIHSQATPGPLPDVVKSAMRDRAYSESALHDVEVTSHIGVTLRNISDQFSRDSVPRRRSLNLIQRRQAAPIGGQAASYPEIGLRRERGILTTLKEMFR